ncbi:MAG TPA: hypothetical protein VMW68_04435 [Methyloceanibacter sp.]|nr:hypothetical protein [Methyloceanibacter sp.]
MIPASGISYWDAFVPSIVLVFLAIAILPWLDRNKTAARTAAIALCLFLAWRYMTWRITSTLPPVGLTLDFALGFVFTAVEFAAMVGASISFFFLTRTRNRTAEVERNLLWKKK